MGSITIVGLGPGNEGCITVETMDRLRHSACVLLRTVHHPSVAALRKAGINFTTYDYLYEEQESFAAVYDQIAADVICRARVGADVVYAVPGSPLVAERSVTLIRERAAMAGVRLEIMPGMSFLEVLYVRVGADPIDGLTIIDAADLSTVRSIDKSLVITQVYSQTVASDTKLALMELLPDEYEVQLIRHLGLPDEQIRPIKLYEIDRHTDVDHLTSLFVPAPPAAETFSLSPLTDVMATLRSPGGCVWDLEQTHKSLRRYLVEEVYEVLEAVQMEDAEALCEELGDLLLQIVFHARLAEEDGLFSMQDVIDAVTEKMIRRHPHVFGDVTVEDAAEVLLNWDEIKRQEKTERKSLLDGVSIAAPGLLRAAKFQSKAAKVGFDWPDAAPVWDKIAEELAELRQAVAASDADNIEEELGDVLFAVVNLARFLRVDAELAMQGANDKFARRFRYVEERVDSQHLKWENLTLKELDCFWDEAKAHNL